MYIYLLMAPLTRSAKSSLKNAIETTGTVKGAGSVRTTRKRSPTTNANAKVTNVKRKKQAAELGNTARGKLDLGRNDSKQQRDQDSKDTQQASFHSEEGNSNVSFSNASSSTFTVQEAIEAAIKATPLIQNPDKKKCLQTELLKNSKGSEELQTLFDARLKDEGLLSKERKQGVDRAAKEAYEIVIRSGGFASEVLLDIKKSMATLKGAAFETVAAFLKWACTRISRAAIRVGKSCKSSLDLLFGRRGASIVAGILLYMYVKHPGFAEAADSVTSNIITAVLRYTKLVSKSFVHALHQPSISELQLAMLEHKSGYLKGVAVPLKRKPNPGNKIDLSQWLNSRRN
jgi:hypothetical protein